LPGKRVYGVVGERWSGCVDVLEIDGGWTLGGRLFKDTEDLDCYVLGQFDSVRQGNGRIAQEKKSTELKR
jgi:hypothetical protein